MDKKQGREIDLRETWNKMAPHYHAKYGNAIMFYEKSMHLKLMGNVKEKKLLDLGCGSGETSVFFAKEGAIVTGVDISDEQIKMAKELANKEKVKVLFIRGKMENLSLIKNNNYDIINSSHAIHYVEKLQPFFKEIFRILRPEGRFVFSVSHPFSDIVWKEGNNLVVKYSYFKKGRINWHWEYPEKGLKFPTFISMRKVSDYFNALTEAGFLVEHILEPELPSDMKNSPWTDYKAEEEMVPGAIIFGAKKPLKEK